MRLVRVKGPGAIRGTEAEREREREREREGDGGLACSVFTSKGAFSD